MSSGVNSFLSVCPPDHQQSTSTEAADRLVELGAEGKGECPFEALVHRNLVSAKPNHLAQTVELGMEFQSIGTALLTFSQGPERLCILS